MYVYVRILYTLETRGDSLLSTIIIEGRMEGKKKRGRPRMMLLDSMMKED